MLKSWTYTITATHRSLPQGAAFLVAMNDGEGRAGLSS